MKTTTILSLLVALAVATPIQVVEQLPDTRLYNRSPQRAKGKDSGAKASGGATEVATGKGGNNAMKNGWEPVTKAPAGKSAEPCLSPEDCDYSHLTMDDLVNGPCKAITFIFARATTELGNMGAAAGTGVSRYLSGHYGIENVAIQGVKYAADMAGNLMAGGCASAGITEAVRLFNLANTKCPNTIITAGGYSQGTACIHRSIPKLSAAVKSKIVGVVLFGDTQATQTGRKIDGMPATSVKIYCNTGDAVCSGTLVITQAHFQYTPFVAPATQFLISQIDAKKPGIAAGGGAAPAPEAAPAPAPTPAAGGEEMAGMAGMEGM